MNIELKNFFKYIIEIIDDILTFWGNNKFYFVCTVTYFYISFYLFGNIFYRYLKKSTNRQKSKINILIKLKSA